MDSDDLFVVISIIAIASIFIVSTAYFTSPEFMEEVEQAKKENPDRKKCTARQPLTLLCFRWE